MRHESATRGAADAVARLEGIDDAELETRVRREGDEATRTSALIELLARGSEIGVDLAATLLTDSRAPLNLRIAAARGLGHEASATHERALLGGLQSGEPALTAAVAKSLARIGGADAYEGLKRVEADRASAYGARIAFARTLLSYRLGLGAERIESPAASAILDPPEDAAVKLETEAVAPTELEAARSALEREVPAIALSAASVRFSCRGQRHWVVLTKDASAEGLHERLAVRESVAAVVFKEFECPGGWSLTEYILTHPTQDGGIEAFGARPAGRLVHHGHVHLEDRSAVMRLRAVDGPAVLALRFDAEYSAAEDQLTIREAVGAERPLEGQMRPATPRPAVLGNERVS